MSDHLAILGASGHGKVIADAASLNPKWQTITFFDDAWPNISNDFPWPVVGTTDTLLEQLDQFSGIVVGIGNNEIREKKHNLLTSHSAPIVSIIHPQSYISSLATIGLGTVVLAQAVINIDTSTGVSCIINTGATVDHDSQLGDFVHICPGTHLGGLVNVGTRSWIGIGSAVRQSISIGSDVVVGAGSTVVKSLASNQVVVGTPARPL